MKKIFKIISAGGLIVFILYSINLRVKAKQPNELFSKTSCTDTIYLEFKNLSKKYSFNQENNGIRVISNDAEIDLICAMLNNAESDYWAPHRPVDFNICINFDKFREIKCNFQVINVSDKYVLDLSSGLYRSDEFEKYLIDLFQIKKTTLKVN